MFLLGCYFDEEIRPLHLQKCLSLRCAKPKICKSVKYFNYIVVTLKSRNKQQFQIKKPLTLNKLYETSIAFSKFHCLCKSSHNKTCFEFYCGWAPQAYKICTRQEEQTQRGPIGIFEVREQKFKLSPKLADTQNTQFSSITR